MKAYIAECWAAVMDNRRNPLRHLDLASQHYFMQVLAWMWSMIFCLAFLSIFNFAAVWLGHMLILSGVALTVAVFRESEKRLAVIDASTHDLSASSRCVWKMDSEA